MPTGGDDLGKPYSVRAFREALVDLALAGVLGSVSGLVVGRGFKYDAGMQDELASVILEVVEGKKEEDFPILMNVDFGHTSPFLTIPLGALATMDSEADQVVILEAGVLI